MSLGVTVIMSDMVGESEGTPICTIPFEGIMVDGAEEGMEVVGRSEFDGVIVIVGV